MKNSLQTFIVAFILNTTLFAQVPNGGFETWTSAGAYSTPDSWSTLNPTTNAMGVYTCTKGTPGSPGSSYLKLTSKTVTGMGVAPGVAVCGTMDPATFQPKSGFAFSQRPQNLTGSWQHMIMGSSQGFVDVQLTKWNTSTHVRDVVATAHQVLSGMAMSWTTFSITLTYVSGNNPDSCIITLSASGSTPTNNDYLWVDNLAFTGSVMGIENKQVLNNFKFFPNPATDKLNIEFNNIRSAAVKIQLVDISGKLVKEINAGEFEGNYKNSINTAEFAKGVYFIKLISGAAIEVKKFIID